MCRRSLAAILEKMMAKDPAQRYQTPMEIAELLAPWTKTPIPPPPETEMPQLSPAAMGVSTSDPNAASRVGATDPPSGTGLRKPWQLANGTIVVGHGGGRRPLPHQTAAAAAAPMARSSILAKKRRAACPGS